MTEGGYAFHHGGRKELQFNIGRDRVNGVEEFRFGVAFSFEPSPTLPNINDLLPNVRLFNQYLQMYPEQFADMRMWHYVNDVPSGEYAPSAIVPELVRRNVFVFMGKRQPVAAIDYEAVLSELDRLLPLYEYVESSGVERQAVQRSTGFEFRPGITVRVSSANVSLAERELNITFRHNLMQAALYRQLKARYGEQNVRAEQPTAFGTLIDVTLRVADQEFWYYEIKTASSPRICLREAMGQILEYSLWPGAQQSSRLIVCGESRLDAEAAEYLTRLRADFNIPIYYEQIAL